MSDHEDGEEDMLRPRPRPHKPTGLTPMKAKRGKAQDKPAPPPK